MATRNILARITNPVAFVLLALVFRRRQLRPYRHIVKYVFQYLLFQKLGGSITHSSPILREFDTQAGSASGHYFHQDLLVASQIYKASPARHIDIGSSIDGLVAHVASFRKIEVMDVRKLNDTGHENIVFYQADLMDPNNARQNITDSLSCLHAIEHFGLGRYGDPIDPDGHKKGFINLLRMLQPEGTLYISFPIGMANAVYFNAHRIFHPKDILSWTDPADMPDLIRFDYVDDEGNLHQNVDLMDEELDVRYGCGIYTLKKK